MGVPYELIIGNSGDFTAGHAVLYLVCPIAGPIARQAKNIEAYTRYLGRWSARSMRLVNMKRTTASMLWSNIGFMPSL